MIKGVVQQNGNTQTRIPANGPLALTREEQDAFSAQSHQRAAASAEFLADEIAPGAILLRYVTTGPDGTVRRSSLWVKERGRWLLRHHQGTPEGAGGR